MEKFKELVSLCKGSIKISVNGNKDYYESIDEYINEKDIEYIDKDIFKEMIKRNIVVKIQVYPHTPIGFFLIYHYDIDEAVNIALQAVKNDY
jgi:hypothetical protein